MKQRMFRFLAILFGVYLIQHFFSICQLIVMDEGLAQGAFTLSEILGEVILFLLIIVLEMFEKNFRILVGLQSLQYLWPQP